MAVDRGGERGEVRGERPLDPVGLGTRRVEDLANHLSDIGAGFEPWGG